MGALQGALMTPLGPLVASANLFGQMSCEFVTGVQPSENSQVMLGAHWWGMPDAYGGVKAAIEWQHHQLVEGELAASSTVTAAVTRPSYRNDGSPATPSWSLAVAHRMSLSSALACQLESAAEAPHVLSVGGSRQLSDKYRLRGKWSTTGVLGLALEQQAEKSALTLSCEMDTTPGKGLSPKFGFVVQLSED